MTVHVRTPRAISSPAPPLSVSCGQELFVPGMGGLVLLRYGPNTTMKSSKAWTDLFWFVFSHSALLKYGPNNEIAKNSKARTTRRKVWPG